MFSLDHTMSAVGVTLTLPNISRNFSLTHDFKNIPSREPAIVPEGNFEWIKDMELYNDRVSQNMSKLESMISTENPIDDYDSTIEEIKMIDYTTNKQRLALRKNSLDITIDDFGDGHKSGLMLINLIRSRKNTVILIEEIESHQHPSSLKKIIENIVAITNENNNQLIITTHSPDVLENFTKYDHTKFFHLLKNDNAVVNVNEILYDDYTMWKDIGWDINNYLSKEKIIIVEGEIDQIIFRHCFKKLYNNWPEESGINIVYSSGKGKTQKELLKALSYGTKTIFYQTDLDKKSESEIKKTVFDYFKEMQSQGKITENNDKITFQHKSGTEKILIKNNILCTGDTKITSISSHAIEDHIISTLIKNPDIVKKLNGLEEKLKNSAKDGKEILQIVFTDYSTDKLVEIMNMITNENMDETLKNMITKLNS